MNELETRKLLVLSTAHLRPETSRRLTEKQVERWPVFGAELEFGFFIHAPSEDVGGEIKAFAEELWICLAFAENRGFDYVLFDRDAETIDDLAAFDWAAEPDAHEERCLECGMRRDDGHLPSCPEYSPEADIAASGGYDEGNGIGGDNREPD